MYKMYIQCTSGGLICLLSHEEQRWQWGGHYSAVGRRVHININTVHTVCSYYTQSCMYTLTWTCCVPCCTLGSSPNRSFTTAIARSDSSNTLCSFVCVCVCVTMSVYTCMTDTVSYLFVLHLITWFSYSAVSSKTACWLQLSGIYTGMYNIIRGKTIDNIYGKTHRLL